MHRCNGLIAVGLTALLALTGCTSADPQPSSQSPTVSESNSVLPPSSFDGPEMDALYAEAEQVFLRSMQLRFESELQPQQNEFPAAEMSELLADPYLSWVHGGYDYMREQNWHGPLGVEPTLTIGRYPGVSKAGSEVALQACLDTRQVPALDVNDQVVSEGSVFHLELFFKRFDGQLKLFEGGSTEVVECGII